MDKIGNINCLKLYISREMFPCLKFAFQRCQQQRGNQGEDSL